MSNLFSGDVEEGSNLDLLNSSVSDAELLSSVEKLERVPDQPIVEYITMDDEDLVRAIDQIESEQVCVLLTCYFLKMYIEHCIIVCV